MKNLTNAVLSPHKIRGLPGVHPSPEPPSFHKPGYELVIVAWSYIQLVGMLGVNRSIAIALQDRGVENPEKMSGDLRKEGRGLVVSTGRGSGTLLVSGFDVKPLV